MREAAHHMQQLIELGADYITAVIDTVRAFEVDQFKLQAEWHRLFA